MMAGRGVRRHTKSWRATRRRVGVAYLAVPWERLQTNYACPRADSSHRSAKRGCCRCKSKGQHIITVLRLILSYLILSYLILFFLIFSYLILSYPILSYPVLSYRILSWVTVYKGASHSGSKREKNERFESRKTKGARVKINVDVRYRRTWPHTHTQTLTFETKIPSRGPFIAVQQVNTELKPFFTDITAHWPNGYAVSDKGVRDQDVGTKAELYKLNYFG